jgi:hypothetical protein
MSGAATAAPLNLAFPEGDEHENDGDNRQSEMA